MIHSLNVLSKILGYTKHELFSICNSLQDDLLIKNYYYSYKKRKSNGKFRIIAPSCNKLKDIQNRLQNRVFSHIEFPYYITGSLKNRSGVINGKIHSGRKFHLQTDLSSFFDFVTNKKVYSCLIDLDFSPDVARLITQLSTYKGHLPQGAPTSPFLANLAGLSIDKLFLNFCESNDIIYSRYVDDLTFSSKNDFKNEVPNLLGKIREIGFIYNHSKTFYKIGNIQVTGVVSGCNGLKGTDNQVDNLISRFVSQKSKLGIIGHLNYIQSINTNFKLKDFKENFKELEYPKILLPYMNFNKPKVDKNNFHIYEYFEDTMILFKSD